MRNVSLLLALMMAPSMVWAQWTELQAPPNSRYDDLFFLNADTGWACGAGGKVVRTYDGGDTWQVVLDQEAYLRSIEFSDAHHGFCGSLDSVFYHTTDGGDTWTEISGLFAQPIQGICGLSAPTPEVVYGVGVVHTPAFVVKTTDAGATWSHIDMSAHAELMIDALFFDPDTGLVTGGSWSGSQGMTILRTTDGGATWTEVFTTGSGNQWGWKIQSPDGMHIFVSIESILSNSQIPLVARSADRGLTWTLDTLAQTPQGRLQGVGFLTPLKGWAGHDVLYGTTNGGATWSQILPALMSFNRFHRITDQLAFAGGSRLYRYQEGEVGVLEHATQSMPEHVKVWPNPAGGIVTVEAHVHVRSWTRVELRAATGALVESLYNGWADAGTKRYRVDLASRASGMYHIVLNTSWGLSHAVVMKE